MSRARYRRKPPAEHCRHEPRARVWWNDYDSARGKFTRRLICLRCLRQKLTRRPEPC